jgi:hypothetical protein
MGALSFTVKCLDAKADDGVNDVEKMILEHAPDLPNNTRSSICDALSSYVRSQMKDCSNKLLACATPLYQYCAMVDLGQTSQQEKVEG